MRICSLASGSRGNCIYIETPKLKLLIDAGISSKAVDRRCKEAGIDITAIDGILVTHEHADHVMGLSMLSSSLNIPVYCHPITRSAMLDRNINFNYSGNNDQYELGFNLNGVDIKPFRTPHDTAYSCGYRVEFDGKSIAVATDLGLVNNGVYSNLTGADIVMLESNHNVDMLKSCGYPLPLIRRILGSCGHLSNELCAHTIRKLYLSGTTKFILGHLSERSNLPHLAYKATLDELTEIMDKEYILEVAEQHKPSTIIST